MHTRVHGGLAGRGTWGPRQGEKPSSEWPVPSQRTRAVQGLTLATGCSGLKFDMIPPPPGEAGSATPSFTRGTWRMTPLQGLWGKRLLLRHHSQGPQCAAQSPVPRGESWDTQASGHILPPSGGSLKFKLWPAHSYLPLPRSCSLASGSGEARK